MCDNQGNYIFYKVYELDNRLEFDIKFQYKENAEKYAEYMSKKHNVNYKVKEMVMCIGIPDYKDEEILEALNNV